MASIQKRVRNGKISYSVRYRDPAGHSRRKVFIRAERWFSSTVALRPGTRRTYRLLLDNQILPHFGGAPLASIDPLAIHEWQAGLVAAGLSPSRIRNAAQVLGQILDAAVSGGRLHRNPAQGLRRPRIIEREMTFSSAAELERLASQIADPTGAGALPRLDGLADRGGGRPSGRAAGSARPPGRGGRGGDRGERPARMGAD
jgi:Phage integrase, N-terminal SAM-like domain